ncbi:MAG: DUF11 domain-containing protein [Gemmataceae bacterium]|nr:DUF11 domain-containing protein [Gemmataceae bacterium]
MIAWTQWIRRLGRLFTRTHRNERNKTNKLLRHRLDFEALEDRLAPAIGYVVPNLPTPGNQGFGGSLGMDFDVNTPITMTQMGVFDDNADGLSAFTIITPLQVRLFNRDTQVQVGPTVTFDALSPGTLINSSRFKAIAPILLPAGFHGTIEANGFSAFDQNGNTNGAATTPGVLPFPWFTDSGGGLISFVGSGRFDGTPGVFPTNVDGGPADRYAAGTFVFNASAVDLAITKTDGQLTDIAGTTNTYTIVVSNPGPASVAGATVSDLFPAALSGVTFTSVAVGGATGNSAAGSGNILDTVNLPVGSSITYTATGTIDVSATGTLSNTATVTPPVVVTDLNPANNSATDDTVLITPADIQVSKTDSPDPVIAGTNLTYTITVTNAGPSDAQNVQLTDIVPAGTSPIFFIQTSGPAATGIIFTGTSFVATFNTLAAGATATFLLAVQTSPGAANGSAVTNTAFAIASTADPNPGNNSDTESTTVINQADLSVTKTDTPDPVFAGTNLTYTITVSNAGPNDALNAALTDVIPANTTFVSAIQTAGPAFTLSAPPVGGTGTFTATGASFAAGATATFEVTVQVNSNVPLAGTVTNTAAVSSSTVDPNLANNSATASTLVLTQADLVVAKIDTPDPVIAGSNITYTISVTNNGPSDALNVTAGDIVPGNTTFAGFVSINQGGASFDGTATVTANFGTVVAGTTATLVFVVTTDVNLADGTTITNGVAAVGSTADPAPGNNFGSASTTVITQADLTVTKNDSPDPVNAGANVTYTITVTNNGPNAALNVVLSDALPAGTSFVSGTASQGTVTGGGISAIANLGAIAAGDSATFTIVAHVDSALAAGAVLTNTATVASDTTDPVLSNNTDAETTSVLTSADISVVKSDGPDPVIAGNNVTYTLTITNNGPSDAQNVTVEDVIPDGTNFVAASTQQGGINLVGDLVTFTVGTIASGATVLATVTVNVPDTIPDGTVFTNTAVALTSSSDPNLANNTDTEDTAVINQADLSVTKADSPDPVFAGTLLTYTITLTNAGPNSARDVSLTDVVPADTTFVSFTAPAGWAVTTPAVGGTGPVTATNPLVPVGANVFTLVVQVNSNVANNLSITNTATVSESSAIVTDPNLANNSDTETTLVQTQADLAVTKVDSPDPVIAGTNLTYTVTVTNNGPSDAQTVLLTDTLPTGTTFVSATASQGTVQGSGTLVVSQLGTITGGATATVTIVAVVAANVPDGSIITNSATVSTSTPDPNPANNTDTEDTTVINQADVAVTKSDSPDPVIAGTNLTYTITVTNAGPNDARDVSLTDVVPPNSTFVSFTAPAGWTSATPPVGGTGTVTATNALVPVGDAVFTLVVQVNSNTPQGGTITNTADVAESSTITNDPNLANNSDSEVTAVITQADLAVIKTDTPDPVIAGTNLTYTVTVTNNGPSDAQSVDLTDTLPAEVTFVSATASQGTVSQAAGVVTANLGTVTASATATVTIVATVILATPDATILTNTATVTSATTDTDPSNNTDEETTLVQIVDLEVVKTDSADSADTVVVGTNLTYTITVTHNGSGTATNVELSDDVPANTTFVSFTAPVGWTSTTPAVGGTGTVNSTTPTLAPAATAVFTMVVQVDANVAQGTVLSNTATVASAEPDQDPADNTDTETATARGAQGAFFLTGDNRLFVFNSDANSIDNTGAFAKSVSAGVDALGHAQAYFTDGNNQIHRFSNGVVTNTGGFAKAIFAGQAQAFFLDGNNQIWIVRDDGSFTQTAGFAKTLSLGRDATGQDEVYFTDGNNQLWRFRQGVFTDTGGFALTLEAGRHGQVAFTDGNQQLWLFKDVGGFEFHGAFVSKMSAGLDAAGNDVFWVLDSDNMLRRLVPSALNGTGGFGLFVEGSREGLVAFSDGNQDFHTFDDATGFAPTDTMASALTSSLNAIGPVEAYFLNGPATTDQVFQLFRFGPLGLTPIAALAKSPAAF